MAKPVMIVQTGSPLAYRPSARGTLGVCALMLLWIVSFLPDPLPWGVIPGFIGALWLVERCATTRSFLGWSMLFGALGIGFGYRWLSDTVQLFGGVPAPLAWLLTALFGIVGVLHGWVFACIQRSILARGHRPHPLTVVALWVACESLVPRLFPWMAGHGVVEVPPLRQLASLGGVPLVSFATLCLVAPLHELLRWADPIPGRPRARPLAALVTLAVGVALGTVGALRYADVREAERSAEAHLAVGIVQANVGSVVKRAAEDERGSAKARSAATYSKLSKDAAQQGAELIVWPETAVTESIAYTAHGASVDGALVGSQLRRAGFEVLEELGVDHDFLIGAYEKKDVKVGVRHEGPPPDERWNSAVLRARGDVRATWSSFRKVYLIPFGETMPLGLPKRLLPQRFTMVPGESPQALLRLGKLSLLPFLCYEGILPDYVREAAGEERPDLLVSLANDSWFGDSWEPSQHLNFTRFRAVEHGVPMVRATNTGVSAFVSATGDVEARLAVGAEGALVRDVPLLAGERTLFVRFGHHLPWLLAVWGLYAWGVVRLGRRQGA